MGIINRRFKYVCSLFVLLLLLCGTNVDANHGPGTGGGATTIPAITLKSGTFSLGLRTELTEFESISDSNFLEKLKKPGSFDVIDRTFIHTG